MTLRWYHRVARRSGAVAGLCCLCFIVAVARGRSVNAVADFKTTVQPILEEYCYDCHADGMSKGGIAFDELTNATQLLDHNLWMKVLKNTRAGIMPPRKKRRPAPAEQQKLENWVKFEAFGLDPKNPDPGRVTIRRLNRVEYRNTIRDLLGVDFRADVEFPPDDTGYGFDNIGDVLSVSPLLIEKYMEAAKEVVSAALPGVLGDVPARARRRESCLTARQLEPARIPKSLDARRTRAREIVKKFATRAFRRPVDDETLDRLMTIAQRNLDGSTENFRRGVAQTMVAVLSSPRFLFRLEQPAAAPSKEYPYPEIDEFSLASRLSYFLWSTMPDQELFDLANKGELRVHLSAQVTRMLQDPRAEQLARNFTGQWLETRDVTGIVVNERPILLRDRGGEKGLEKLQAELTALKQPSKGGVAANNAARAKRREELTHLLDLDFDLNEPLRRAMQLETEMCVSNVFHENRPITELIEADYTYVNHQLAAFYGLTNEISDGEMHRVHLPPGSPRGGVLTDASVLLVTSNPDRTSPVKRGLFVLENILNTPTPPPPPNTPSLELAEKKFTDHDPTPREALEAHRSEPLCFSCHSRLDPIGFGFENFNAMGMWRQQEGGQPISPEGKLITGETFTSVRQLKHILATSRKVDFYRCFTEKLFTYALGRGMEYYDTDTMDRVVERLQHENGRFMAVVMGIVESAPFQRERSKALMAAR